MLNKDKIEEASCTCPYYKDTKEYCKHIYALLCKIECAKNTTIIDSNDKVNNVNNSINPVLFRR